MLRKLTTHDGLKTKSNEKLSRALKRK